MNKDNQYIIEQPVHKSFNMSLVLKANGEVDHILLNGKRKFYERNAESFTEKPKKITWYAADSVWNNESLNPETFNGDYYYKSKEECLEAFLKHLPGYKIVTWKTIDAPEKWEQCE